MVRSCDLVVDYRSFFVVVVVRSGTALCDTFWGDNRARAFMYFIDQFDGKWKMYFYIFIYHTTNKLKMRLYVSLIQSSTSEASRIIGGTRANICVAKKLIRK